MDNKILIVAVITYSLIIALTGFLCWLFHSGWFVLVLLFIPSIKYKSDDKEATD